MNISYSSPISSSPSQPLYSINQLKKRKKIASRLENQQNTYLRKKECKAKNIKIRSRVGLNHRPFGQQPSALPTELREHLIYLASPDQKQCGPLALLVLVPGLPINCLQLMLQLKIGNNTTQIEKSQNQQNILELTKLIGAEKHNQKLATLYTNRGVLYYQSGKNEQALSDMEKALEYNYLNYAVYFNIFSILCVNGNLKEGLKNLCCALSCLYLIRGKKENSEGDISKCVKLAQNNCEGRLMKALYYQKKKKHNLALNQIQWILDTEPHNLEIIQIKNYIQSLVQSTRARYNQDAGDQEEANLSIEVKNTQRKRSLICTLYDDLSINQDFNCEEEIKKKLDEFNQLLKEIIDNVYLVSADQPHQRILFIEHTEKVGSTQAKLKSEELAVEYQEGQLYQELKVNTSLPKREEEQIQVGLIQSQPLETIKSSSSGPQSHGPLEQVGSIDSYFVTSSVSRQENLTRSGLDPYLFGGNRQKSSGVSENYDSCGSFTVVKAKDDNKQISIKVENIEIIEMDDEEKYNNMYCLFEYGENKITLINSTGWNEHKTEQILGAGEEEGKKLVVKLYNKEILAFNDRFLGEGSEEIKQSGLYTISLYSNKFQGSIIGEVELSIRIK